MFRTIVLSSAVLAAAAALGNGAVAQGGGATAMQPGDRMRLGPVLGDRTVRQVMISEGGGGIEIVYDMAPGAPQSQRVLRLENVNGMLEVIYDAEAATMALGGGGTPRLVQQGGGMYSVEYQR